MLSRSFPRATTTVSVNARRRKEALQNQLDAFWLKEKTVSERTSKDTYRKHAMPLARIKKVMKLDEDVQMISRDAPVILSRAVEMMISELTMRSWTNTDECKRRTLQRCDIATAIAKAEIFDCLIDIVPREEAMLGPNDLNGPYGDDGYGGSRGDSNGAPTTRTSSVNSSDLVANESSASLTRGNSNAALQSGMNMFSPEAFQQLYRYHQQQAGGSDLSQLTSNQLTAMALQSQAHFIQMSGYPNQANMVQWQMASSHSGHENSLSGANRATSNGVEL